MKTNARMEKPWSLVYSVANAAWFVMFGESVVRIFTTKTEALAEFADWTWQAGRATKEAS